MRITDVFVLPDDVQIKAVSELPADLLGDLVCEEGEQAIIRLGTRMPIRLLDEEGVKLLLHFRPAKTIGAAIIEYCRGNGGDPQSILEEAYPMLRLLIDSNLLVPADSPAARPVTPSFRPRESVAGCRVVRCLQWLTDSELYHVKDSNGVNAALKIARPEFAEMMRPLFTHEAEVLRCLDGRVNPPLLAAGDLNGRPYLRIGWCPGEHVDTRAHNLRPLQTTLGRQRLLKLSCAVLDAYTHLHAQGVVHGDVHPRNILISDDGQVSIIDFGFSRREIHKDSGGMPNRGGIPYYYEPEYAWASLERRSPPHATQAGEQYALAALLYELITGKPYTNFSVEIESMLQQITKEPPLPFADQGVAPWPEIEAILCRALSKSPPDRYGSLAEFSSHMRTLLHCEAVDHSPPAIPETAARIVFEVLDRVGPGGSLSFTDLTPPTCSVYYGAAGIAFALYRMACSRGDALLLSQADVWTCWAESAITGTDAFRIPEAQLPPEWFCTVTPFHQASGVYLIRGLVSQALGDPASMQRAIDSFVTACSTPCTNPDLTLGNAGVLLSCGMLLEAAPDIPGMDITNLLALGNQLVESLWASSITVPNSYLGIAHGWAGILYATLHWHRITKNPLPEGTLKALEWLAAQAKENGNRAWWPVTTDSEQAAQGWCHGSVGYVWLWTIAHHLFKQESYLQLAIQAAQYAWDTPAVNGTICCGMAGQAYAMLHLYRYTGEKHWLQKAFALTEGAADSIQRVDERRDSLFKGHLGVAVLAVDLEHPNRACFPLFEIEGWPGSQKV
ncbi:hypothetical protein BP422_22025 [Brevibacillus formosus]|uniref:Protein kinase domain-containing protein n=1 Tax=Brevibacillus formosus TaxID=54913 RepID=A0A220MLK8_9BACL|nr:lanthionine synthetase LanC family protein [Brevibacillus formosus]ASJ55987.1 hypothetical protein BP422_22025 [Brevibacillus formosus]